MSEVKANNYRVRFTWGRGYWSFDYYETDTSAREGTRIIKYGRHLLTGAQFARNAQRIAVQKREGSKWRTIA